MSSVLEQRFPDSVFLRNTKGERARFKKANLGNRNWAGWVHLQSYGKAPAVLVSDLKVGDYILYNYGYKSQVKSITPKGKASVVVETESSKDGKLYDRTYRLKSLIPILSDRQIQIHQRLKSKGYAAETKTKNKRKRKIKFSLAEDLIDDASDYYNKCLNRDGYHPEDEDEEHIVDLCREAEALARSIGLDVEYRPYMNRLGISDLDDQLYEEGKESGLERALMVTSFGADEEEEEEDLMYHWDEEAGLFFDYMILEQPDGEKIIVYWIMNEDLDQVGKGQISLLNDNLEIDSIFIEPSYQRKGIATSFVNHVVDYWGIDSDNLTFSDAVSDEGASFIDSFRADEEFYEEYPAKYYQTDEDEGVFYLPATDSYWLVQGEDALTKEQSKELAFGAEAGTYRINWKDGKRGVTFDYEGGDDMHFDDTWTDLFWDASNPQVTEAPARKKRGLFRGKRGAESFNAVVVAPEQPKGSVEKALMNHYLFQESAMRQALMEIENRVDLGMMSVEEAERKLNRLIQQKMRSENYASENTSKKLLSGVFMLVAVASLWRAVTVAEDAYLFPKENKYMTILGSASIGLGILAWKGDTILAALED